MAKEEVESKATEPEAVQEGPSVADITEYVSSILTLRYDVNERVIYLMGDIDEDSARQFIVILNFLDNIANEPIRVLLSSDGGAEESGYAIYDAIKLARNAVLVDGIGMVASIAAIVLQAGDVRRLSQNAVFMVHHGSITMPDHVEQDKVMAISRLIETNNVKYHSLIANRTGIPVAEIRKMSEEETYLSATEAVRKGFADFLWLPKKKSTTKLLKRWVDSYKEKK